jgi:hypothetical protein
MSAPASLRPSGRIEARAPGAASTARPSWARPPTVILKPAHRRTVPYRKPWRRPKNLVARAPLPGPCADARPRVPSAIRPDRGMGAGGRVNRPVVLGSPAHCHSEAGASPNRPVSKTVAPAEESGCPRTVPGAVHRCPPPRPFGRQAGIEIGGAGAASTARSFPVRPPTVILKPAHRRTVPYRKPLRRPKNLVARAPYAGPLRRCPPPRPFGRQAEALGPCTVGIVAGGVPGGVATRFFGRRRSACAGVDPAGASLGGNTFGGQDSGWGGGSPAPVEKIPRSLDGTEARLVSRALPRNDISWGLTFHPTWCAQRRMTQNDSEGGVRARRNRGRRSPRRDGWSGRRSSCFRFHPRASTDPSTPSIRGDMKRPHAPLARTRRGH